MSSETNPPKSRRRNPAKSAADPGRNLKKNKSMNRKTKSTGFKCRIITKKIMVSKRKEWPVVTLKRIKNKTRWSYYNHLKNNSRRLISWLHPLNKLMKRRKDLTKRSSKKLKTHRLMSFSLRNSFRIWSHRHSPTSVDPSAFATEKSTRTPAA